jgi:hypothetical protein
MWEIDINNLDSLRNAKKQMDAIKKALQVIVEPFWSDELDEKRRVELAHVAKFVFKEGGQINEMRESPDFLIQKAGKLIGLEVTQLFTKHVEYNRHIQRLFDHASRSYEGQFGNDRLLVNFCLDERFNYRSHERAALVTEIVDYVHGLHAGTAIPTPRFILRTDIQPHYSVDFNFNEGAYSPEAITDSVLLGAIEEKEAKFDTYVANSETPFQWLLLVNREAGSEAFDTAEFEEIADDIETKFEHIFLLRDFDFEVIKIH